MQSHNTSNQNTKFFIYTVLYLNMGIETFKSISESFGYTNRNSTRNLKITCSNNHIHFLRFCLISRPYTITAENSFTLHLQI